MATQAPIIIVSYDPRWPDRFADERALLIDAIGPWLAGPIEHIGSTAIRGMPAKPVIDMMPASQVLDQAFRSPSASR
jgi:GrpB-like predicted nucleotidyltransferase (UPF0157 family)